MVSKTSCFIQENLVQKPGIRSRRAILPRGTKDRIEVVNMAKDNVNSPGFISCGDQVARG